MKQLWILTMHPMEMGGMKISLSFLLICKGGGIGGCITKAEGYEPSSKGTLVYLNGGEDLSTPLSKIEKAGGKIIMPKTAIGPNGLLWLILPTLKEIKLLYIHGNKKWQQSTTKIIVNASLDKVWNILTDLELLDKYDPTVKKSTLISADKTGIGAKRKVNMLDGKNWFEEKVTVFKSNVALTYQLTDCTFPMKDLQAQLQF